MKEIPFDTIVHVSTEKETQEFCDFVNKNGYNIQNYFYHYKENLCYRFDNISMIYYCYKSWYEDLGYEIISFKEFKEKYMETPNEIRIEIPEGMEIDAENSTFECIKFKPKKLTYEDISKNLFRNTYPYFFGYDGEINRYRELCKKYDASNLCLSEEQAEKILALNKLINVAHYLNDGWKPDYKNIEEVKYYIVYNLTNDFIFIEKWYNNNYGVPCFKSLELAKQAIKILGEETIKLALSNV